MVVSLAGAWWLLSEPPPPAPTPIVQAAEPDPAPEPVEAVDEELDEDTVDEPIVAASEPPKTEPEPATEPEPEPEAQPTAKSGPPPPPPKGCTPHHRAIKQLGPKKWSVKRSLIDRYASDLKAAERLARVRWATNKSGKRTGIRLVRVPCKSPLRAAGFESGDLILSVNGRAVTSVASGLRVWAGIKMGNGFTVRIRRKKAKRVHTYVLKG